MSAAAQTAIATNREMSSPSYRENLRILFVTPRYFPFMGGVQNHVYQVARRLAHDGMDVTILTTDVSGQLPPEEQSEGFVIRRVRAWPRERDYYFAPGLHPFITQGNWDIVHIQSYHTLVAPLAMLAALQAKIPYIVTFHGGGHSSKLRTALRGLHWQGLRPLLARAARLIATARFEVPLFSKQLRLPKDRFAFIPNGGDLLSFDPATLPPTDDNLIVSIGRLERYKGHHRVLAALPAVLKQRPDLRLWIAGAGPFAATLQRMAVDLGVADHVEIRAIPISQRQELAEKLARAALVISLSEYETHPMAILEAIALGRSTLVADTSGLREIAEHGYARAVSLRSTPDTIASAILEQLRHPLHPQGVHLPTWDDCAADLCDLYQSIVPKQQYALLNT